mgnify:FL=1
MTYCDPIIMVARVFLNTNLCKLMACLMDFTVSIALGQELLLKRR